jgi:NAD(P)H dehydrogenase (quinone)
MNHLIIYAHPNSDSLNHHLKETIVKTLKKEKQNLVVRDLYQLHFDPVLSLHDMQGQQQGSLDPAIQKEQEFVNWADTLTFIYPIWWTGLPAMMKGYIDRVMSYGFAYRYDNGIQKGLLKGKKAVVINTHGKSKQEYRSIGMNSGLSLTSDTGIYRYCGLEIIKHVYFDRADQATAKMVNQWTLEVSDIYVNRERLKALS